MSKKLTWKGSAASYNPKKFPETKTNKVCETIASFHVK